MPCEITPELLEAIKAHPEKFKVSQEIELEYRDDVSFSDRPNTGIAIVLDTEATDVVPENAEIIALSILPIFYDKSTLEILGIHRPQMWLNEPSCPISEEVQRITGLTDEVVKGHRLDIDKIESIIETGSIFIAHNAAYDRVLMERYFTSLIDKPWACTYMEIPWKEMGYDSMKLRHILSDMGYFYNAHRADADCEAVAMLLQQEGNDASLFENLIQGARSASYTICFNVPYGLQGPYKERQFYWKPEKKVWQKTASLRELQSDIASLKNTCKTLSSSQIFEQNAFDKYSHRNGRALNAQEKQELFDIVSFASPSQRNAPPTVRRIGMDRPR